MPKASCCGHGEFGGNLPGIYSRPAARKHPHLNHRHHSLAVVPCHLVSRRADQGRPVPQRLLTCVAFIDFG
jgi:hypothetical protein